MQMGVSPVSCGRLLDDEMGGLFSFSSFSRGGEKRYESLKTCRHMQTVRE